MNIYLIGMPGVGKTSVGRELAVRLGYKFIDLDQYLEMKYSLSIKEMIASSEEKFRQKETDALNEASGLDNLVIACGGGIVVRKENHRLLKKNSRIILLETPLLVLEKRLANSYERPLLNSHSLSDLYSKRKDLYLKCADIIIDSNREISEIIEDIVGKLDENISNKRS